MMGERSGGGEVGRLGGGKEWKLKAGPHLHDTFRLCIECRGGFIEQHDLWVLEDGTSDSNPLLLPS